MSKPLISIIVCCHNRAHMLPATLDSVFSQNYHPVEILVVDDGSTDSTPALMAGYGDKIRYYWHENQGVTKTRTIACQLAKGEFIAFIDDDDLMPPNRIETLYQSLLKFPQAIFATGDFEIIDDQGKLTGQRWLPKATNQPAEPKLIDNGHEAVLWPRVAATVHTSLFKKADGEKIGWFDTNFRYASEDKDFFARLGLLGPIVYVPEVVSLYRRGHNSLTTNNLNVEYEQLLLFTKHIKLVPAVNKQFKNELQMRLLNTLVRISFYKNKTAKFSKQETDYRIKKTLQLLTTKNKLNYYWNHLIKNPLKRFLITANAIKNNSMQ